MRNPAESGSNGAKETSPYQQTATAFGKYVQWQPHPKAEVQHEGENPLSAKVSAVAAASRGDNCVRIPGSDERLIVSGPYLQLLGYDSARALWRASVLIVTPPSQLTVLPAEPVLTFYDGGSSKQVQGLLLGEHARWKFWRFDVSTSLSDSPRRVEYALDAEGLDKTARYPVALPSKDQGWNWGYHSCNGLSAGADVKKWAEPELWKDVLAVHQKTPMHALVGGGDQIYNDAFWSMPSMKAWLDIPSTEERLGAPFTPEMEKEVSEFLFNHYRVHFNSREYMALVFACIPQMNLWDDHDIWDGWGSYPEHLQSCPVFQGAYACCKRFYLLFQHHTTEELSRSMNDLFGPPGTFSYCRQLGARVAIVGPDCRAQRSVKRIISPEAYEELFKRIGALPQSIKHIVVVTTVPIVFPKLPLSEATFTALDNVPFLKGALQKTGIGAGIVDKFDHADLLDDIVDHWDAKTHLGERRAFVERLQAVAKRREARISFISGDVHCAGIGRLYSRPKMAHLRHDYRFMPQVVSSAIWNCPPPGVLLTLLQRTNKASKINHNTQEKMVRDFDSGQKLLGQRNWCFVQELPTVWPAAARTQTLKAGSPAAAAATAGGTQVTVDQGPLDDSAHHRPLSRWMKHPIRDREKTSGALVYQLRVEDPEHMQAEPKAYTVICPVFVWNPLRNHVAVRRSSLIQACMCIPKNKVEDPLQEL
ncbi:Uncharacterized protein YGR266W [Coccomyxa sp. Obi]|nr:Uncharacterized protein YGR266W [Coccomyxa sp. Obi]